MVVLIATAAGGAGGAAAAALIKVKKIEQHVRLQFIVVGRSLTFSKIGKLLEEIGSGIEWIFNAKVFYIVGQW